MKHEAHLSMAAIVVSGTEDLVKKLALAERNGVPLADIALSNS